MTPFQATFYYINNKRKIEKIENSFLLIKDQLNLYEKQVSNTIKSYLRNKEDELEELEKRYIKLEKGAQKIYDETLGVDNPDDKNNIDYATHISGIDYLHHRKSEEIENIENKYLDFLDLFSKSTLVALYSLNENFLNNLCDLASQTFEQKIKVSHFNSRDYLKASFNYLELVIDLPKEPFENQITKLQDIQKIRNKIIHAGSQIKSKTILELVAKYSDSFIYDEETHFLRVKSSKFTKDFFNLLKNLYHELLWNLEKKQNYKNLKNIFENWFGLIERKITIAEINSIKISDKSRTIDFKAKSDNKKLSQFCGKLTFTSSKGYNNEIIDQTENDLMNEFLETDKDLIQLKMELKTFITFDKKIDIKLLVY